MKRSYSVIVPVYNRPEEIEDLLNSISNQTYGEPFEIIIVDDGSTDDCKKVVEGFSSLFDLSYYYIENRGPGKARNFGMEKAKGNYFIIFDSDITVEHEYLQNVEDGLTRNYTDVFGGPDRADEEFTVIQKAVNFSMTSFLTTGGIRGNKRSVGSFQPRSFNMGISRKAYEITGGFSDMRVGEDIDLSLRAKELNLSTQLIPEAFVYHKRRADIGDFTEQAYSFGKARPYLNRKFKGTARITYWFPTFATLFFIYSIIAGLDGIAWPLILVYLYGITLFLTSTIKNRSIAVGFMTIFSTMAMFFGYGSGFLVGLLQFKNK